MVELNYIIYYNKVLFLYSDLFFLGGGRCFCSFFLNFNYEHKPVVNWHICDRIDKINWFCEVTGIPKVKLDLKNSQRVQNDLRKGSQKKLRKIWNINMHTVITSDYMLMRE